MAQLIVEPAERSLCRTRMIILDEVRVNSDFREAILVVRLQKRTREDREKPWVEVPRRPGAMCLLVAIETVPQQTECAPTDAINYASDLAGLLEAKQSQDRFRCGLLAPDDVSSCSEESRFS